MDTEFDKALKFAKEKYGLDGEHNNNRQESLQDLRNQSIDRKLEQIYKMINSLVQKVDKIEDKLNKIDNVLGAKK